MKRQMFQKGPVKKLYFLCFLYLHVRLVQANCRAGHFSLCMALVKNPAEFPECVFRLRPLHLLSHEHDSNLHLWIHADHVFSFAGEAEFAHSVPALGYLSGGMDRIDHLYQFPEYFPPAYLIRTRNSSSHDKPTTARGRLWWPKG